MVSHQAPTAADRGADTPVPELRQAGVTMVYGSDNNTNDVFEVMRVAMLSERLHRKNDPVPGCIPSPKMCSRIARWAGRGRSTRKKRWGRWRWARMPI
jgi:cytosine/adenosine deaminase-related metal-dependent hydrolase